MITDALRNELGPCWISWTLGYAVLCGIAAGIVLIYFGVV